MCASAATFTPDSLRYSAPFEVHSEFQRVRRLSSSSPPPRCRHHLVSFLALASEILTCTARKRRARAQGKITALSSFHRAPSLLHYSNRSPNTLPARMRNKVPRARVSFSLSPFPAVFLSLSSDCSFIICRRRRRRWRGPLFTRARARPCIIFKSLLNICTGISSCSNNETLNISEYSREARTDILRLFLIAELFPYANSFSSLF